MCGSIKVVISLLMFLLDSAVSSTTESPCPLESAAQQICLSCHYEPQVGWQINCANSGLSLFPTINTQEPIDILNLGFNSILYIEPRLVRNLQIRELLLQNNILNSTAFLNGGDIFENSLEYLDLSENSGLKAQGLIRSSHFTGLINLSHLKVNDIGLTDVNFLKDSDNDQHLKSLEVLEISYNDLSGTPGIHPDTFHGKNQLKTLKAAEAGISDLRFLDEPSLRNLETLELQRNEIDLLMVTDIRELTSLTKLNMRENLLTSLSRDVLENLPAIEIFDWGLNNAVCDCSLAWLRRWLPNNPNIMTLPRELSNCPYVTGAAMCLVTDEPTSYTSTEPTSGTGSEAIMSTEHNQFTLFPFFTTTVVFTTDLPLSAIIVIAVIAIAVVLGIALALAVCLYKHRKTRHPSSLGQQAAPHTSIRSNDSGHIYDYIDDRSKNVSLHQGERKGKTEAAGQIHPSIPSFPPTSSSAANERYDQAGYLMPTAKPKIKPDDEYYVDPDPEKASNPSKGVYQSLKQDNSLRIYSGIPESVTQSTSGKEATAGTDNKAYKL